LLGYDHAVRRIEGGDVELREYLRLFGRQWWLILWLGLLGLGAAALLAATSTRVYTAGAQIFVATSTAGDGAELAQGNTFTQARVQSYVAIVNSPSVTGPVVARLGLPITAEQLADQISASAPPNKVLIDIRVHGSSPALAAELANAVAIQFTQVVSRLEDTSGVGHSPVRLTVTQPATPPTGPSSPRLGLDLTLGLLAGLLAGAATVALRHLLNTSVRDPEELESLAAAPVLAVVGFDRHAAREPVAFRAEPHGARAEAFRQLRTNLQFVNVYHRPRVIAVTSSLPGEGKTSTALNLAAALAEAGNAVILLEADLRRPTLAAGLGLVRDVGLTTVLIGQATVEEVMQSAGDNLSVITSGPIPPNPSELLASAQTKAVLKDLAQQADFTIIDSAPLLPVADGAEVAALADATLLVARWGRTSRHQLAQAVEVLAKVNKRPVGTVLNMAKSRGPDSYLYTKEYAYTPAR
jgi:capsular exopolysaccharide synthesis family protein